MLSGSHLSHLFSLLLVSASHRGVSISTCAIVAATPTSTEKTTTDAVPSSRNSSGIVAGNFVATKPIDWPTATQAGPAPTSTVTSISDPCLEELSKAYNNSEVSDFTSDHTGDMTY
ncbi:hypothetical protein B0H13DRAFT_2345468 [Mycena leptocephala]|nr:hypothetical protein B0H13DRAFT_2345468 [Mycena leptocephala]